MRAAIHDRVAEKQQIVDINGWMARTTLEMLGQAGLGYSFDNFAEDSADAYGDSLKNFLYVKCHPHAHTLFSPLTIQRETARF